MRRLLTGGIKAILAIAALSTAAHWAMRVQREPAKAPAQLTAITEPATTGSIAPSKPKRSAEGAIDPTRGLDQRGLSELFGSAAEKPKPQKAAAKASEARPSEARR